MIESKPIRVRADFNGLFGELLCLSHKDTCEDARGNLVKLRAGMVLTAFDEDADEHGNRDDLIASGTVEPSPKWLSCRGSRWVLRIDSNGVKHESELQGSSYGQVPLYGIVGMWPNRLLRPKSHIPISGRIIKGRPFGVGFDRSHQRLQRGAPLCRMVQQ